MLFHFSQNATVNNRLQFLDINFRQNTTVPKYLKKNGLISVKIRNNCYNTYLTFVAINMKTTIQSNNSNSFILTWLRHYRLFTNATSWSKFFMKIFDTMYLVSCIDRKRNSIQTFTANNTAKTFRMIRFTSSSQNAIQNWFHAYTTFFQSIL